MNNIKILSADTSGKISSVALLIDDKVVANYTENTGLTHSQKFLPLIDRMLSSIQIGIDEIDYFAFANGPGSFTGLRIGGATIKGLAHSLNKPIIEVSTLDGLFYNIPFFDGYICPIIDARRQEVYTAVYYNNEKVVDDTNMRLIDLFEIIKNKKTLFLGDGVLSYKEFIMDHLKVNCYFAPNHLLLQNASSVGQYAFENVKNSKKYNELELSYLKQSQPEEILSQKLKK